MRTGRFIGKGLGFRAGKKEPNWILTLCLKYARVPEDIERARQDAFGGALAYTYDVDANECLLVIWARSSVENMTKKSVVIVEFEVSVKCRACETFFSISARGAVFRGAKTYSITSPTPNFQGTFFDA